MYPDRCLLIHDDGYATGLGVFLDCRKQPLFLEAAVEFWLGTSRVVLPSQDIQLDPGRHTTLGPLGDLVEDHDVVHVVVVAVVVCLHFCFCERLLEICVKFCERLFEFL
jgi:hypothetical protein